MVTVRVMLAAVTCSSVYQPPCSVGAFASSASARSEGEPSAENVRVPVEASAVQEVRIVQPSTVGVRAPIASEVSVVGVVSAKLACNASVEWTPWNATTVTRFAAPAPLIVHVQSAGSLDAYFPKVMTVKSEDVGSSWMRAQPAGSVMVSDELVCITVATR